MLILCAHRRLRMRLHTDSDCIRIIYRANRSLVTSCILDFFLSHVGLVALLAIGNQGGLVKRDSFCAERSVKVLNLAALMTLECPHERLPRLAPNSSRTRTPVAAVVLTVGLGLSVS